MDIDQPDSDEAEEGDAPAQAKRGKPRFFVNPEIVWSSEDINVYQEGCLSVPGQYADVERPEKVRLRYLDYQGHPQEEDADGLFATCIQHEMDHLNGILFIDHLSTLKRDMLMRKLKKYTREHAEEMKDSHVIG
jgi:peptide deformylase